MYRHELLRYLKGTFFFNRCFLGSNAGPAQWPDCNRYVEAVISRLCDLNPSPERSKGSTKTRWTLVCRAYKEIRERIINNGKVITETRIQMPEVNQATVSQWFIRREKKRDKETLQQGIPPPPLEGVTEQPLPEAVPCLLYTSPSPRDLSTSRMPSSA